MNLNEKITLVVGASEKSWRYSFMALQLLESKGVPTRAIGMSEGRVGHTPILLGKPYFEEIHTVTMYVSPEYQEPLIDYLIGLKPKRIIFNPGTENFDFEQKAEAAGIEVVEACTLVMLRTGQF